MKKIALLLTFLASTFLALPCMAQSFEAGFDPTSAFANGEQDLQAAYYGSFDGSVAAIYQRQTSEYGSPDNGDSNIALIEQTDSLNSTAQIWQVGMGNNATITQLDGESNIARLAQVGIDHIATIRQEGSYNTAIALMQGSGAFLQATQTGESNYLNVVLNTGSQLRINQEGIGNVFTTVLAPGAMVQISQVRP
ncbi:MAG: hypothetical protein HQ446_08385 [Polaromonas sp.]|nr:hypothetical protein [Polaromonas sp.]